MHSPSSLLEIFIAIAGSSIFVAALVMTVEYKGTLRMFENISRFFAQRRLASYVEAVVEARFQRVTLKGAVQDADLIDAYMRALLFAQKYKLREELHSRLSEFGINPSTLVAKDLW